MQWDEDLKVGVMAHGGGFASGRAGGGAAPESMSPAAVVSPVIKLSRAHLAVPVR
jgi:hypothetical protein